MATTLSILGGILLCIIVFFIVINNRIVTKNNRVKQAYGSIEIYLKQRFDLLPNLIALLQQYMAHEKDILTQVTQLRSQANQAHAAEEKIAASNEFTKLMGTLQLNVEQYPDLKADKQFANVQYELTDIEEQISAARRAYNAAVTVYNDTIQQFPGNLVAGIRKDQTATLLHIPKAEQKEININQLFNN